MTPPGPVQRGPALHAGGSVHALTSGGATVEIRHAAGADAEAVRAMHAAGSPQNPYARLFPMRRRSADQEAERVCRPAGHDHAALLAWLGGSLTGVASYEPAGIAGTADVAVAVAHDMLGHGIATLLLEHLVSLARLRGLTTFTAATLTDDSAMLRVFAGAGLPGRRRLADGVLEWTFPLPGTGPDPALAGYPDSVAGPERPVDVASLRYLLAPGSVAVIGASRRPGTVGRAILRNVVRGGFAGRVYAVNPRARQLEGVPCAASVSDLPEPPDLAVIAVPARAVPKVAADCGRRGVRALVVITSGLGAEGADLLATCRRHGMRLVGPDCLGIMVPGTGLNATFAARLAVPGAAGLVAQPGMGSALLEHLSRLGIGVSSFASVGDTYDVSSNDMLTWWEQDEQTRLAVLYVDSFGAPRAFARTARRVSRQLPVLTVIGARSTAAQAAAASRTAIAVTPLITQEALFSQAGIVAVRSLGELTEAAALLASQPLPDGTRVAIVSNAGGAGALAADACGDHGLQVARPGAATRRRLRGLLPAGAAVTGPVTTSAAVTPDAFRACLEQVAADDGVDAVLAVAVPTALADLHAAVASAAVDKPLAAALLDQAEAVRLLPWTPAGSVPPAAASAVRAGDPAPATSRPAVRAVPAFARPDGAARALSHAARYRAWRDRQAVAPPELGGLRSADARDLIAAFLAGRPGGGWLPAGQAASMLSCYQIPLARDRPADGENQPAPAAAGLGGTEVLVGVLQEAVFGPLVVLGPAGASIDVLGGYVARLAPLTGRDADEMIAGLYAAPLPTGHRRSQQANLAALADVLLRVSRLAEDLPAVAELDLNPVIAGPDGACAADARIRVAPAEHRDPFLRRLR